MSFLGNAAERFFDKHGDTISDVVNGWTAVAPAGDPGERELRRLHNAWLKKAETHRTYWGVGAKYEWIWPGDDENARPFLWCPLQWTFVRRTNDGLHLVAENGFTSFQAWHAAGFKGLTDREPTIPPKPKDFMKGRGGNRAWGDW